MRKAIAWLCFTLMLFAAVPGLAQEGSSGPSSVQSGTSITVASPNAMSGIFATEMFGNNTADMDVRALLHGYETVAWTRGIGLSVNNTVVADIQTAEGAEGGASVYTLTFASNLTYNDGTPITARDYAFYFLLAGAPEIKEIGGTTQGLNHIIGYDAYMAGQTKTLQGIRLVSDNALEIHIDSEYFPYFYGLVLISARPYPISVIAPGCEVKDDGSGVYISGEFSASVLRSTLLDPGTGYVYNPRVTSGPYQLEAYDPEANTASFTVNTRFAGNYEGQKPVIERLTFQYMTEDQAVDALNSGTVDLFNKLGDGVGISGQIEGSGLDGITQQTYLRSGFAFLSFACEESPTDSAAVRKAISMTLDRTSLVLDTMPNFAAVTYGYNGLGQWMTTYKNEEDGLSAHEEMEKLAAGFDLSAAEALLVEDGWTYNADGQNYQAGQDSVRHKQVGGQLVPLEIRWAVTTEGPYIGVLRAALEENLPKIGIQLTVTELDFPTLLEHYYRQTDRTYNMFFMASNFGFVFDPYYDFNIADEYQGTVNTTGLRDAELMNLAKDMRETDSADTRGYVDKWLLFQARFIELMPMVPLYSNIYSDLHTNILAGYDIASNSGWAYAILYAYISQ